MPAIEKKGTLKKLLIA